MSDTEMRLIIKYSKRIVLGSLIFTFLFNQDCLAQHHSKWLVGISFNMPRIIVYSLAYYPNENCFLELSAGGAPHYGNIGFSFNYLSRTEKPNILSKIGSTLLTSGGGPYPDFANMSADSLHGIGGMAATIDVGFGRQFLSKSRVWYFSLGPSYIWYHSLQYINSKREYSTKRVETIKYLGFFDFGAYLKKED